MRSNRWASVMVIGSLAGFAVGCGEEAIDSSDIRTHGIYADFTATANGKTTKVDAVLLAGGDDSNTYVELKAGDTLIASMGDDERALRGDSEGKHYTYTFDTAEGGTKVTINFDRTEDEDAPDSTVTLPASFAMSLDVSDDVPRGDDVKVTWDPAGDGGTMYWKVSGDCIWDESGDTDDDGAYTLSSDDIEVKNLDAGDSCNVTVTLERHKNGKVDSTFGEGGKFVAIQRRSKTFKSVPGPEETGEAEATGGKPGTTETGGSANVGAAGNAGEAGSSAATGGTGTGGVAATEAGAGGVAATEAGAGGAAATEAGAGGAAVGGANEASAGNAGESNGQGGQG